MLAASLPTRSSLDVLPRSVCSTTSDYAHLIKFALAVLFCSDVRNLQACGLTDQDFDDLNICFDDIGRDRLTSL